MQNRGNKKGSKIRDNYVTTKYSHISGSKKQGKITSGKPTGTPPHTQKEK